MCNGVKKELTKSLYNLRHNLIKEPTWVSLRLYFNFFVVLFSKKNMDRLNKDITREISSYLVRPKYKMVDWIKPYFESVKDNDELWNNLNRNKYSYDFFIKNYPEKIDWGRRKPFDEIFQ
jgi:hypothetical protein